MGIVVVLERKPLLLHVVGALRSTGRLAGSLHGWKQKCNQDPNDGDHHQQFDKRKCSPLPPERTPFMESKHDNISL